MVDRQGRGNAPYALTVGTKPIFSNPGINQVIFKLLHYVNMPYMRCLNERLLIVLRHGGEDLLLCNVSSVIAAT